MMFMLCCIGLCKSKLVCAVGCLLIEYDLCVRGCNGVDSEIVPALLCILVGLDLSGCAAMGLTWSGMGGGG